MARNGTGSTNIQYNIVNAFKHVPEYNEYWVGTFLPLSTYLKKQARQGGFVSKPE